MKKLSLFFAILVPFFCFGQLTESFTDGNFTENPMWVGSTQNFVVNPLLQLQSKATVASTSFLFAPSEAINDAVWQCSVKIDSNPSSANYSTVYIVSDKTDLSGGCNGYFVQIGGSADEVSLYLQEGTKKTKIIDGVDKRTDKDTLNLRIKVTRTPQGLFTLYSKLSTESEFVLEGSVINNSVAKSNYFGLQFVNSSTKGNVFFFDDIEVSGTKAIDTIPPVWEKVKIQGANTMKLVFSEAIKLDNAVFTLDNNIGNPLTSVLSADKTSVELTFSPEFQKRTIYTLTIAGITDLEGNSLVNTQKSIGITEPIEVGDVVFNEIMFDNPSNSLEYIEIANNSDKVLDISGCIFTTRKTDGTLNTGNVVPSETLLLPKSYLAMCSDAAVVKSYHHCPVQSTVISTTWTTLNNESSTLVLCNATKDTVFDELTYQSAWHHPLVKNPTGVALERIHPSWPTQDAASWHSASSEAYYGTPGYQNSQYREVSPTATDKKFVWADPSAFSPDNDGIDDVCLIRYVTDAPGYVGSATIFNPAGAKVYQLATNILLSTDGFITWDGTTDSGKNANVGVYVVYFEMFNALTGARKHLKFPIVVTAR